MKILTLKGSQWARGGKNGPSALLNREGASCCLGIDLLSCLPVQFHEDVENVELPSDALVAPAGYLTRWCRGPS